MINNTLQKALVETLVRKALRDIKDSPERGIRNLVDMALNFSKGRFQTKFFQSAQRLLSNEHSAYYRLVRNIAQNIDHERLLRFGMNIGYNGCTLGAKGIREIEAAEGFNIPWALFLEIDSRTFPERGDAYGALLRQGKELGIYTWFLHADEFADGLFDLMAGHEDCAFILFCEPDGEFEQVLDRAAGLNHLMLSIALEDRTEAACRRLREREMLYAIHMEYSPKNMKDILNDNLLYDTQNMNATFTAFMPAENTTREEREILYDYIVRKREEQGFATILWEAVRDVLEIDTVISDDGCSAGFRPDGSFFTLAGQRRDTDCNLFSSDLKDILKRFLKK